MKQKNCTECLSSLGSSSIINELDWFTHWINDSLIKSLAHIRLSLFELEQLLWTEINFYQSSINLYQPLPTSVILTEPGLNSVNLLYNYEPQFTFVNFHLLHHTSLIFCQHLQITEDLHQNSSTFFNFIQPQSTMVQFSQSHVDLLKLIMVFINLCQFLSTYAKV